MDVAIATEISSVISLLALIVVVLARVDMARQLKLKNEMDQIAKEQRPWWILNRNDQFKIDTEGLDDVAIEKLALKTLDYRLKKLNLIFLSFVIFLIISAVVLILSLPPEPSPKPNPSQGMDVVYAEAPLQFTFINQGTLSAKLKTIDFQTPNSKLVIPTLNPKVARPFVKEEPGLEIIKYSSKPFYVNAQKVTVKLPTFLKNTSQTYTLSPQININGGQDSISFAMKEVFQRAQSLSIFKSMTALIREGLSTSDPPAYPSPLSDDTQSVLAFCKNIIEKSVIKTIKRSSITPLTEPLCNVTFNFENSIKPIPVDVPCHDEGMLYAGSMIKTVRNQCGIMIELTK